MFEITTDTDDNLLNLVFLWCLEYRVEYQVSKETQLRKDNHLNNPFVSNRVCTQW